VGILLSTLLLRIFQDFYHIDGNLVKAGAIVVVVAMQYSINKLVSFRTFDFIHPTSMAMLIHAVKKHWITSTLILASAFCFFFNVLYVVSPDEGANMLGAKLILQGQLPSIGFFSHHAPGAFFLAIPFYLLSGNNPVEFRIFFNVALFAWLIFNSYLVLRYFNRYAACIFLVVSSLSHIPFWGHLVLAESFIINAASTVLILLIADAFRKESGLTRNVLIVIAGLLLFMIPFVALAYIFIAALLFLWLCIQLVKFRNERRHTILLLVAALSPVVLYGVALLATGSLKTFLFENLTFNAHYYGPFFGDQGSNPFLVLINIIGTSTGQIVDIFSHPKIFELGLFMCYIVVATQLVIHKKYLGSLLVILFVLVADPRVGLYGPPGISGSLDQVSQHSEVYKSVAILMLGLIAGLVPSFKSRLIHVPLLLYVSLVILLGTVLGLKNLSINDTLHTTKQSNLSSYAARLPSPQIVIINKTLTSRDSAWVGPLNFYDQLYLQPERATRYTFYAPWHEACPKCRDDFFGSLKITKPEIIYRDDLRPGWNKQSPSLNHYLKMNYVQFTDPRLKNLYFLASDSEILKNKLIHEGDL
jgi:hypothetical protein